MALILLAHAAAQGQAPAQENASCLKFVQQFYGWYVPLIWKTTDRRTSDVAIERRPEVFGPRLLRALKSDAEVAARTKGDEALDFDPFVGSQDPADRYEVRHVTSRNGTCAAEIWGVSKDGRTENAGKPDAVADLALDRGNWQFINFHYPELNTDLISVLAQLEQERRKH